MAFPGPKGRVGHPDLTQNIGQNRPNGVYKTLVRHGLNTRAKRLALVAGYRAPFAPPREPAPEPHIESRPAGRAGRHRLLLRRAAARRQGTGLADHRDRHLQLVRLGRSGRLPRPRADRRAHLRARAPRRRRAPTRRLAARARAHRQRQRVRPPGRSAHVSPPASRTPRSAPDARRPTATSNDCTAPSSKSAGGPPSRATSKSATAACDATSPATCTTTTTTATTTDASPKADAPPTSSTVPARWSRDEPHLSAQLGVCSA